MELREELINFLKFYKDTEECNPDIFLNTFKKNKEALYNLLGKQYIYKFTVKVELSEDQISEELENSIKYIDYIDEINTILDRYWIRNKIPAIQEVYDLFNTPSYVASNIYSGKDFTFEDIFVNNGCKTLKIMKKILLKINLSCNYVDYFITFLSTFRNQAKLEGNLCISIHPVDFLTASYNECSWSSCYNIFEGSNSAATIQYCLNKYTVIAYLESQTPMEIGDMEWSNKKWREFFYVSPQVISSIKAYPYDNTKLTLLVMNKLKELAKDKWGIYFDECLLYSYGKCISNLDVKVQVVPFFNGNNFIYEEDFTDYSHYTYVEYEEYNNPYDVLILDFSSEAICPYCGNPIDADNRITCIECSDNDYCSECNHILNKEYLYQIDGKFYCRDCLTINNSIGYSLDIYENKPYKREECITITLAFDDEYIAKNFTVTVNKKNLNKIIGNNKLKNHKYIFYDELTDLGKKLMVYNAFLSDSILPNIPKCEFDFIDKYCIIRAGNATLFLINKKDE